MTEDKKLLSAETSAAWRSAQESFVMSTDIGDREKFYKASPQDTYDEIIAIERNYQRRASRKTKDVLQPLIEAIEEYGRALDTFANIAPMILAPIWGSILVILVVTSKYNRYYETIIDMLGRIGDVLPRFSKSS